jgi:Flp pilus assembly protein TadG
MAQYRSRTTASCALPAHAESGAIAMTGLGFQGGRLGAAIGRAAKAFARRFTLSKSGGVAMIFGLAFIPLSMLTLCAIDFHRASTVRLAMQDSLDAASLAAARNQSATTTAQIQAIGTNVFNANMHQFSDAVVTSSSFTLQGDGTVIAHAEADVTALVSSMFIGGPMHVSADSEVKRSSKSLEVAMVLDTTGSMSGSKIEDLKDAANELIDMVVQDVQTPHYSKVAIVPYSQAVNAGSYATTVRGDIDDSYKSITAATRANPVVITASHHGRSVGDRIYITGVSGMTELNGRTYTISAKTTNTITLSGVDGRYYHSFNGSNGRVYCASPGCRYYGFTAADGSARVQEISNCVTERTGAQAYTDVGPGTALVGRNYPDGNNDCIATSFTPLSATRSTLHGVVNNIEASGSTAGQIGIAWGWYMLSPNWGSLWPSSVNRPAAYGADELIKVAIIMTDGEFNTNYCNGVIAKDAGSGSGGSSTHNNCNGTNGSAFTQGIALCNAMKAKGIIVYTVGFDVGSDASAQNLVNQCATDSQHVYQPSTGTALKDAFRSIATDIMKLRISQ